MDPHPDRPTKKARGSEQHEGPDRKGRLPDNTQTAGLGNRGTVENKLLHSNPAKTQPARTPSPAACPARRRQAPLPYESTAAGLSQRDPIALPLREPVFSQDSDTAARSRGTLLPREGSRSRGPRAETSDPQRPTLGLTEDEIHTFRAQLREHFSMPMHATPSSGVIERQPGIAPEVTAQRQASNQYLAKNATQGPALVIAGHSQPAPGAARMATRGESNAGRLTVREGSKSLLSPASTRNPPTRRSRGEKSPNPTAQPGSSARRMPVEGTSESLQPGPVIRRDEADAGPFVEQSTFLRSTDRTMTVSIETEICLQARTIQHQTSNIESFAATLIDIYNRAHAPPLMSWNQMRTTDDSQWQVWHAGQGIQTVAPWRLRIQSPMLRATPGSRWRQNIYTMWSWLLENYHVSGDHDACDTHIWFSMNPDLGLAESNLIAQAIIYFEAAIDALLPHRNGSLNARSNWLHAARFAPSDRSRLESMRLIQPNPYLFVIGALMGSNYCIDERFGWNFQEFGDEFERIQFRKPGLSTNAAYGLSWAEFTMAFVLSAIQCESMENLLRVPPNVRGLKWFLQRRNVRGLNDSPLMRNVWGNFLPEAMLTPRICLAEGILEEDIPSEMAALDKLAEIDADWRRGQVARTSQRRPPYF